MNQRAVKRAFAGSIWATLLLVAIPAVTQIARGAKERKSEVRIDVDASTVTGKLTPYFFGQNIEHEHGTVSRGRGSHTGGLWAEMLRDRKFEEGDADHNGVSDGWVPEERIANRYWELVNGQGPNVRYRVDHQDWYGGGASQAIELYGSGSSHASIYQTGLHLTQGNSYTFYVYMKLRGAGAGWVEFDNLGGPSYGRIDFPKLSDGWQRYTAEFTAPETTTKARISIGVQGVGTFWIDSASLMPADNVRGFRRDVIEALKPMDVTIVRYPGGCFADTYHWQDGIGPRDQRPERWSPIWEEWESGDFGTDEFMDLARELGFEPHMTVNYLSGTPEEAAQWVEYVNGSDQTRWGRVRSQNGHPQPYGVKWWAVGNEPLTLCSTGYFRNNDVSVYAQRFMQYESAIHKVDPNVEMIAGAAGLGPVTSPFVKVQTNWNQQLFRLIPPCHLEDSIYTGPGPKNTTIIDLNDFYRKTVAEPVEFNDRLNRLLASFGDTLPPDRRLFGVTEWNSFWVPETEDPDYHLADALYVAGVYNAIFRHAQKMYLVEFEGLVDVQGTIEVNQTQVKLTPEYFAYMLYRHHTGTSVLATSAETPMVSFNAQLPALDALATLSEDGRTLDLAVINRNEAEDLSTTIQVRGWTPAPGQPVRAFVLNGNDKNAANTFGKPENVSIKEESVATHHQPLSYLFPAHSVTVLEFVGAK